MMLFPEIEKALYLNFDIEFKILQDEFAEHMHSHPELCIVFSGSADHIVNGKKYKISAGDVFVINKNVSHSFEKVNKLNLINLFLRDFSIFSKFDINTLSGYNCLYRFEEMYNQQDFSSYLHLNSDQLEFCNQLCKQIVAEFKRKENDNRNIAASYINSLIAFLSRMYENDVKEKIAYFKPIFPAVEFIENNFCEEITLEKLSLICNLSKRHLCRLFKEYYAQTPTEKIISLRIKKASELLKLTNMSVTEICSLCGYSDSSFFSKQFTKRKGISPLKYRKSQI